MKRAREKKNKKTRKNWFYKNKNILNKSVLTKLDGSSFSTILAPAIFTTYFAIDFAKRQ
jgi:hypothetical protein